jgi:hypothetical protein
MFSQIINRTIHSLKINCRKINFRRKKDGGAMLLVFEAVREAKLISFPRSHGDSHRPMTPPQDPPFKMVAAAEMGIPMMLRAHGSREGYCR